MKADLITIGAKTLFGFFRAGEEFVEGVVGEATHNLTPMQQLEKALERSKVYQDIDSVHVGSVNAHEALLGKLSLLERMQQFADKVEYAFDGKIRYYDQFRFAKLKGPTTGSRFVVEHNITTNGLKAWNETYDELGNINRIRIKSIDGFNIDSPHFPPTYNDLLNYQDSENFANTDIQMNVYPRNNF